MRNRAPWRPQVLASLESLEAWVSARDFSGDDPYDGLRSRLLTWLPLPGKWGRIAWIQFFKWCPINFRRLFLVPPGKNPKGIGLFLAGYIDLYKATGKQIYLEKARSLAMWLESNCTQTPSGIGWGYNFDWQSRAFFVPAETPTIVNTAFISHALLDLYALEPDDRWLNLTKKACNFIARDLHQSRDETGLCFSYTTLDQTKIHNANLLGVSLLARFDHLKAETQFADLVAEASRFALAHQRPDGSWYYADTSFQSWIDSYHTGFNLFALRQIAVARPDLKLDAAIEKGEHYYLDNLFTDDGAAKYRHNQALPIDIHGPAMGIYYFAEHDIDFAYKQFTWLQNNMQNRDGSFAFLKGQKYWSINRIPYMRWGQAWVFFALAHLLAASGEVRD